MTRASVLLVLAAAACGAPPRTTTERLRPRTPCPAPAIAKETFIHTRSAILSGAAEPRHAASDVVVATGAPIVIQAKVAYGPTSKDLEDEDVALWMEDGACAATEIERGRSDDDGRVTLVAPARATGSYQFWIAPVGDATMTTGTVWVVSPGAKTVLFDIDATLTTSDQELFDEVVNDVPAEMYPDANAVARHWADTGHLIIYLTGRPYLLRASTLGWLERNGFPRGPLITTDQVRDALPADSSVGAFKTRVLQLLLETGIEPARAYGNTATDVCAYARAGIRPEITVTVGRDARSCDDHPPTTPLNSYTDHLRELGSREQAR